MPSKVLAKIRWFLPLPWCEKQPFFLLSRTISCFSPYTYVALRHIVDRLCSKPETAGGQNVLSYSEVSKQEMWYSTGITNNWLHSYAKRWHNVNINQLQHAFCSCLREVVGSNNALGHKTPSGVKLKPAIGTCLIGFPTQGSPDRGNSWQPTAAVA